MKNTTSDTLILRRGYTPRGTFSELLTPQQRFVTLELPWRGNQRSISCIPEGVYSMALRRSGVVERTTGGQYRHGWEVQGVPGRDYIMLHPANTIDDLEGCIAPGLSTGVLPDRERDPQWAILNSFAAFKMVMDELKERDQWYLDVRGFFPEWP